MHFCSLPVDEKKSRDDEQMTNLMSFDLGMFWARS